MHDYQRVLENDISIKPLSAKNLISQWLVKNIDFLTLNKKFILQYWIMKQKKNHKRNLNWKLNYHLKMYNSYLRSDGNQLFTYLLQSINCFKLMLWVARKNSAFVNVYILNYYFQFWVRFFFKKVIESFVILQSVNNIKNISKRRINQVLEV